MALTTCRECGREVAAAAKTCPGCGVSRPDPVQARRKAGADIALVIVLCAIALVVVFLILGALV